MVDNYRQSLKWNLPPPSLNILANSSVTYLIQLWQPAWRYVPELCIDSFLLVLRNEMSQLLLWSTLIITVMIDRVQRTGCDQLLWSNFYPGLVLNWRRRKRFDLKSIPLHFEFHWYCSIKLHSNACYESLLIDNIQLICMKYFLVSECSDSIAVFTLESVFVVRLTIKNSEFLLILLCFGLRMEWVLCGRICS